MDRYSSCIISRENLGVNSFQLFDDQIHMKHVLLEPTALVVQLACTCLLACEATRIDLKARFHSIIRQGMTSTD
jgi:hypothetical protein